MLFDANYFLAQGSKSLAFEFWKQGYDVWITNARGTTHSKNHINFYHTDSKFWNFTYFDWGKYDTYATIKYITTITKKKLIFLGVSAGGNAGIVFSATRPKFAAKFVSVVIAVSPVLISSNVKNSLYYIRPLIMALKVLSKIFFDNNFISSIFRNGTTIQELMAPYLEKNHCL